MIRIPGYPDHLVTPFGIPGCSDNRDCPMQHKGIFITGTDTGVGKTITTLVWPRSCGSKDTTSAS